MKKITITTKNSTEAVWVEGEWDDYFYDGKCFVIIKNHSWIGFYNIDSVHSIIVE